MKNKIVYVLNKIDFANRYITLCNNFLDFNNGMNFTKHDVLDVINDNNVDMKFISKEKLFIKDYFIKGFTARLIIGYKNGFIDCMYWIFKNEVTILNESFRGVSLLQDTEFNDKVLFRFPIATNIDDLQQILKELLSLNNDFISELNIEYLDE
ncbi:hypothetical protein [Chishuiella sp.]|uniref:hypothetical protein n=1 Tax=Chishuiella sp. TaxID=1969467 RepID=UPI0028AB07B1|nr:hypothetical protein [Chishuiella sp.]